MTYRFLSVLIVYATLLISSPLLALESKSEKSVAQERLDAVLIEGSTLAAYLDGSYIKRNPNYINLRDQHRKRLTSLKSILDELEVQGQNLTCSKQKYIELKWLINYTDQWADIENRFIELKKSFDDLTQERFNQQDSDGSWGKCYTKWHFKLDETIGKIQTLADFDKVPEVPLTFLKEIENSKKLEEKLWKSLISDIEKDGMNHRDEINALITFLGQIIYKSDYRNYVKQHIPELQLDDQYIQTFKSFIEKWQDPETGYFGAWYQDKPDHYIFAPDLSITYHIVSYTKGKIPRLDLIASTTLSIKDEEYPYGWKKGGHYNNHNNYDVTRIFSWSWSVLSEKEKEEVSETIEAVLNWTLSESLQKDGSFSRDIAFDNSVQASYYFGIQFLRYAGIWDKNKRFWRESDFKEAKDICCRIKNSLFNVYYNMSDETNMYKYLEVTCPVCPEP